MRKTLQKLGLAGILLAATTLGVGCNTAHRQKYARGEISEREYIAAEQNYQDDRIFGNGLLRAFGILGSNNGDPNGRVAQAVASDMGQYFSASASRSNVNQTVNVGGNGVGARDAGYGQGNPVGGFSFRDRELKSIAISTCNYIRDINGDGGIKFPEEHIGISSVFSKSEKVTFVLLSERSSTAPYRITILDRNGEILRDNQIGAPSGRGMTQTFSSGELQPGTYLGIFEHNGRNLGSLQIRITED